MDKLNIQEITKKVRLQREEKGKVVKKKTGRPRIPPKTLMQIRLDPVLLSRMRKYDESIGNRGPSQLITIFIREGLKARGFD